MSQLECITKKREFKHLTEVDRKIIEILLKAGFSMGFIAKVLDKSKSTISREIKRASVIEYKVNSYISKDPNYPTSIEKRVYYAKEGLRNYKENRKRCGRKSKVEQCKKLIRYVIKKVKSKKKMSIDSAIGNAKKKNYFPGQYVSTKTFYNWIDKGLLKGINNSTLML